MRTQMNTAIIIDMPMMNDSAPVVVDPSIWHVSSDIAIPLITEDHEVDKAVHISANWRAIHKLTNEFFLKANHHYVEFEDCLQVAFEAAWKAVGTFDPAYGAKMSTHLHFQVRCALLEYLKHNMSIFAGHPSAEVRLAWAECRDNLSVDNLRAKGLSYQQAMWAINYYTNQNVGIEEAFNVYDDYSFWAMDEVEDKAYPFDFAQYLTQKEADAIRLEFGFAEEDEIETQFPSRKSVEYARNNAIIKLQKVPGIEQYLDVLRK